MRIEPGVRKAAKTSLLCMAAIQAFGSTAAAMTTPTTGSFMYEAWDIFVIQGIKGAIGAAIVVALVAIGAFEFKKSPLLGGCTLVTAAIIAKADTVAASLGCLI